ELPLSDTVSQDPSKRRGRRADCRNCAFRPIRHTQLVDIGQPAEMCVAGNGGYERNVAVSGKLGQAKGEDGETNEIDETPPNACASAQSVLGWAQPCVQHRGRRARLSDYRDTRRNGRLRTGDAVRSLRTLCMPIGEVRSYGGFHRSCIDV